MEANTKQLFQLLLIKLLINVHWTKIKMDENKYQTIFQLLMTYIKAAYICLGYN